MALTIVTPPAVEPISIAEVRERLPIGDETDAQLADMIAAARERIDGRDGSLGRALITQTWDLWLDRFPARCRDGSGWIELPLAPVQSVTHVKYTDAAGVEQTMAVDVDYQLDLNSEPARVLPPYGGAFPCPRAAPNAVTARFVAGYGDAPGNVPQRIRQHLFDVMLYWMESCDCKPGPVSAALDADLVNYKLFWVG